MRAYVNALNGVMAHDDLALAHRLSAYAVDGCAGCASFQSMGYYDIASARRVGGHTDGNLVTIAFLDAGVDPATPDTANVALGLSASEYRLIDAHGRVVASEPPSDADLALTLVYLGGAWHIGTLEVL